MASPPFNVTQTTPADDDIVSQFPTFIRSQLDIIESWFLVSLNTSGRLIRAAMDWSAEPSAISGVTQLWGESGANGQLRYKVGTGPSSELLITGEIKMYAGSTEPAGWLFCNGQAVSRTTFADLFGRIGTTYGAGDTTTTFNVPDFRGRGPMGPDNMGGASTANRLINGALAGVRHTLGGAGGEDAHTLSTAEMPSHTHLFSGDSDPVSVTVSTTSNNGSVGLGTVRSGTYLGGGSVTALDASSVGNVTATGSGSGSVTPTGTNSTVGSSQSHNNIQPTLLINFIIKY